MACPVHTHFPFTVSIMYVNFDKYKKNLTFVCVFFTKGTIFLVGPN